MKSIDVKSKDKGTNKNAVLNLLMHRKLCNHPNLIINDSKVMKKIHEEVGKDVFTETLNNLALQSPELHEQSGKLMSLISLLEECGLLNTADCEKVEPNKTRKQSKDDSMAINSTLLTDEAGEHRALIFCQLKDYMEMIRKEVLTKFNINHLVLDSSLNPKQRFEVAEKFNTDTRYKVMLLSTRIGSLGLNLTGADTVIFMEHDWNPMSDLQAIDRAHRIGQTKTVTVYRLITIGTLEEKIMNLQRFKKKLHKMLITERDTTGNTGEDKEAKVEVENILKSFENQDAFKNELSKDIGSNVQAEIYDEEEDWENYLSKVDKEWLNLE